MYEFQCGHAECRSEFAEFGRDELLRRAAEHLKEEHNITKATETLMSYLEATCVTEFHEFQCGHQECRSEFAEFDRDELIRRIAEHLKEAHNVNRATETLMSYLEATCVTTR